MLTTILLQMFSFSFSVPFTYLFYYPAQLNFSFVTNKSCFFRPGTYNLFKHNCNSFTEEVSNFLVGNGIPKYILDLPEEILQTYVLLVITVPHLISRSLQRYKYLFSSVL